MLTNVSLYPHNVKSMGKNCQRYNKPVVCVIIKEYNGNKEGNIIDYVGSVIT